MLISERNLLESKLHEKHENMTSIQHDQANNFHDYYVSMILYVTIIIHYRKNWKILKRNTIFCAMKTMNSMKN
jgi:hypothetical protein